MDIKQRYSVSLVYLKIESGQAIIDLQVLITSADSSEEALGKAYCHFEDEMKDYKISNKVVIKITD